MKEERKAADRSVLLISRGSMFLVGALEKSLTEAGFRVVRVPPEVDALNAHREEAQILLFYLGDYLEDIPETLVYLRDLCAEEHRSLCAIGDQREIDTLLESFPEEYVAERYLRPLDIAGVTASLEALALANEALRAREAEKKKILLVDDDGLYLKMMHDWLAPSYHVTIVNSGMQAITWLANNVPDLILLDYEMPITDGPQVLEMIRSEPRTASLPVIFLTGRSDRTSVMKVLALKPAGYLLKSMDRESIRKALDDFFGR